MTNKQFFINSLEKINITLEDSQIDSFLKYYEMLVEKNKVMNLTSITEYEEVVQKHFIDSLSLVNAIDINDLSTQINILDIGTGAGFPGIPLKIAFPNINITLLDSLNKRINFLNDVIYELSLNEKGKIEAVHGRAEEYIKLNNKRESFDYVVSRAVANLSTLSEYCIPYVKTDGYFIPYKSEKTSEEIEESKVAISKLGGTIEEVIDYTIPNSDNIYRTLIKIKKTSSTPDIYPRKAGLPSKKPL